MTLRSVVIGICVVLLLAAIAFEGLTGTGGFWWIAGQLMIVLALIVFERTRYQPKVNRAAGVWKPTGERFEDPTSGKAIEVYENPQTGERDYRPA